MSKPNNVLVVCGPTASGKTSFSLAIAKQLPRCNILSVDSIQLFRGLDIVSGKDIPSDLPRHIQLFGIDILPEDGSFNLSNFVEYGRQVINDSLSSKTPLIIVGGTGFYLQGLLTDKLDVMVPPNPELRLNLESKSKEYLQKYLLELDPVKYDSLNHSDINNPRRLIRAIEISLSPDQLPGTQERASVLPINLMWIGFSNSKENVIKSIKERVLARIESGAIEEVMRLYQRFPNTGLPIYTGLGVRTILKFINKEITKEELIEQWVKDEKDYHRRQLVWFKKQPGIIWYDKSKINDRLVEQYAEYLKND